MLVARPGLLHRENRQALFNTNSGRSSPLPTHYAATRQAEDLEGQNDDYLKGLSSKVRLLKDVSRSLHTSSACRTRSLADAADRVQGLGVDGVFDAAQITINIGNEVRDSTKLMQGMVSPLPRSCRAGSTGLTSDVTPRAGSRTTRSTRLADFWAGR